MSNRHPDKDIDQIFKTALNPLETEPSEKFWNKSYENIIKREGKIYGGQVRRWKIFTYVLGVLLLLLALYMYNMHTKIKGIENQITEVQKNESGKIKDDITQSPRNISNSAKSTIGTLTENSTGQTKNENSHSIASNSQVIANNNKNTVNEAANTSNTKEAFITGLNKNYSNPGSKKVGAEVGNSNNSSYGFGGTKLPGNYYDNSGTQTPTTPNASPDLSATQSNVSINPASATSVTTTIDNASPVVTPSTANAAGISKPDSTITANTNSVSNNPPATTNKLSKSKINWSRFFVAAYFSPELWDNVVNGSNTAGEETANNIKMDESAKINYVVGAKIGFDITKHWSILTGLYYHASSFAINSTILQQQQSGSYSIPTSSGSLQMPISAYGNVTTWGSSSSAYLGIPLQARYNFLPGQRLNFYAETGLAADVFMATNTTLNCSYMDWGIERSYVCNFTTLNEYNGMQSVYFVYNLGIGINYRIVKGLSVFTEPGIQGSITPLSKYNSVEATPFFRDINLGLTYHF